MRTGGADGVERLKKSPPAAPATIATTTAATHPTRSLRFERGGCAAHDRRRGRPRAIHCSSILMSCAAKYRVFRIFLQARH